MSPRLKLRAATPLLLAGAVWSGSAMLPTTQAGPPCQTPPPCSPDGVCLPKVDTYGWYQTRWRTFPGDVLGKGPTKAETTPKAGEETLGGPQPPPMRQEGEAGRPKPPTRPGAAPEGEGAPEAAPPAGQPGPEAVPGPGPGPGLEGLLPTIPGGSALPGETTQPAPAAQPSTTGPVVAPPAAGAQPAAPATEPAKENNQAPPTPEQKLVDPFGLAPPAPPAWMRSTSTETGAQRPTTPQQRRSPELPEVMQAAITQPVGVLPTVTPAAASGVPTDGVVPAVFEGRNANSDDAPPALPAGLQGLTSASTSRRSPPAASAAANRTVRQASAEQPLIMPQVNPASAIATEVGEGGLQQAIYFEATDLGTN